MPYDPYALSEDQKSGAYRQVWLGLAVGVLMLTANIFPLGREVEGFCAIFVGVQIVTFATYNRFDEHFRALASFGFACGMTVIGVWLVMQGLLTVFEGAYGIGVTAAGAGTTPDDFTFRLPGWFNRAFLVVSLATTAFYAGFIFAWLRERRG